MIENVSQVTRATLKFARRAGEGADEGDMILYEPSAAARARHILRLAESVSTWGQLRAIQRAEASELVEPILEFLWDEWEQGEGAYGDDDDAYDEDDAVDEDDDDDADDKNNVPLFSPREDFLSYFPDERRLDIETFDETPRFMDPFSPHTMGVPEGLHRFYVLHDSGSPGGGQWWLADVSDLTEIREEASRLGWDLVEGSLEDLPHY
jgi:hypothetical protein